VDELIARRDRVRGRRFRADAAKVFLDEEIDKHTAALLEPYAGSTGDRGKLFLEPDRLDAIVRRLDAEGFLIHMHAMGDRAVRAGLDAIERAISANGPRDRRHQLAHVGVANPVDLPRFGTLGVAAGLQPLWADPNDPTRLPTETALGPERSRWTLPMASIANAGGRIVASSDWPAPSMNPLDGIQTTVTRQRERIGLAAILSAYTRDAAWAAREDAIDGSIELGKAADLIVLDRDLFEVGVEDLHGVHVLLTLLDGEVVFRCPQFNGKDL
jgi:predicted amidohydrolase YtcJ